MIGFLENKKDHVGGGDTAHFTLHLAMVFFKFERLMDETAADMEHQFPFRIDEIKSLRVSAGGDFILCQLARVLSDEDKCGKMCLNHSQAR